MLWIGYIDIENSTKSAHILKLNGEILEDIYINDVIVSDCDPIIVNNNIVWYYGGYEENINYIYYLDYNNLSKYIKS